MIGNSPIDYVAIRISIIALRSVAPLSLAYLAFCAFTRSVIYLPATVYACLEALFYLLVYLPRSFRLQGPPRKEPPRLTFDKRQALFNRCIAAETHATATDIPYPRGWFLPNDRPPNRDDVVDWLLWALFATSREETAIDEYREEIEGYIKAIEALLGTPLEPGHSHHVKSMRITLDPVLMLHRPLVWYFIVAAVDTYTSLLLTYLGFKHYTPKESQWRRTFPPRPVLQLLSRYAPPGVTTPYWYRPHTLRSERPLVFLHGIGIGLYPYIPFVHSLITSNPEVGILLPEMMSICMHMTPRSVPPRNEMLASLNCILESLRDMEQKSQSLLHSAGWDQVVLCAHSYGTFIAGWIIRELNAPDPNPSGLSEKISDIILVDPIPILLSNPTVAHNFLYRNPSTVCPHRLGSAVAYTQATLHQPSALMPPAKRAWYSSPAAWQLWYFASRDADIAHTLFRSFFWSEGGIWREDIDAWIGSGAGRNIAVVLGGVDQVVPSEAIRKYLTGDAAWEDHWTGTRTHCAMGVEDEERAAGREVRKRATGSNKGYGSTQSSGNSLTSRTDRGQLEVLFNPKLDHAVVFDDSQCTKPLIEVVRRYMQRP